MKARNLIMALCATGLVLSNCTSTPKVPAGEYLIEGELKNVPDSTVIELLKGEGQMLVAIHKDTVIRGRFSFHDTITGTAPQKLLLLSKGKGFPGMWLDVWLQPGKYVKITGEDCLLPLWKISSEVAEQRAANEYMALCTPERKLTMQLKAQEYGKHVSPPSDCQSATSTKRAFHVCLLSARSSHDYVTHSLGG